MALKVHGNPLSNIKHVLVVTITGKEVCNPNYTFQQNIYVIVCWVHFFISEQGADPIGIPNKNRPRGFCSPLFLCKKPGVLRRKKKSHKNQHHQKVVKIQVFGRTRPSQICNEKVDFKESHARMIVFFRPGQGAIQDLSLYLL